MPVGLGAVATDILIGAAIGAVGAVITGGDPLKGALFGAVGGGIGGAVMGAGAAEGISALGGVEGAAATGVEAVGADVASSATQNLAQGIIENTPQVASQATGAFDVGGSTGFGGSTPISSAGDMSGSSFGNTVLEGGSGPTPGGSGGPPGEGPGLISRAMKWATDNPKLASGVLQAGGNMVSGAFQAVGNVKAAEMKGQMELENKEKLVNFYRDFIQGGSSGGAGVKLAGSPGAVTPGLMRPAGTPVYGPSGQLNVSGT